MRDKRTVQMSLLDFYCQHQRGQFFEHLSARLDEHPPLLELIEGDLLRQEAQATGRKGLSVESVFRCALLKQITGASYEDLSFALADSQTYRAFARLDRDCYPSASALCTNIRQLKPKTLKAVFEYLASQAHSAGAMDATMMRLDSTVVEANIGEPSDSRLLDDGIRVLSRLFAKSSKRTGVKLRLTDYRKRSRQLAAAIFYGKKPDKDSLYGDLVGLGQRVSKQADRAIAQVQAKSPEAMCGDWVTEVKHYRHLLDQVIFQTQRRVFNEETVPASEKIVSLFEPHTDIIVKASRGVEYGHKLNLATDKQGLITTVVIEQGNPRDSERFIPLLNEHKRLYNCLPDTTIADGCYASHDNVDNAKALGIKRVAFHKKNGIGLSAMGIKRKTLKRLKDFRAGIEGNISELKRTFGADKAMWKGEDGFKAFVWASIISYNLTHWVRLDSG